MINTIKYFF